MVYCLIAFLIFIADLLSKHIVKKNFALNKKYNLYKNKIYIYHIKNKGLAYGLFKNSQKLIFIFISFGILILLATFYFYLKNNSKLEKLALSFALGGTLGNYYDRLKNKSVTDFIYIKYKNAPIYNIADFFIISSPILILIKYLKDFFQNKL